MLQRHVAVRYARFAILEDRYRAGYALVVLTLTWAFATSSVQDYVRVTCVHSIAHWCPCVISRDAITMRPPLFYAKRGSSVVNMLVFGSVGRCYSFKSRWCHFFDTLHTLSKLFTRSPTKPFILSGSIN